MHSLGSDEEINTYNEVSEDDIKKLWRAKQFTPEGKQIFIHQMEIVLKNHHIDLMFYLSTFSEDEKKEIKLEESIDDDNKHSKINLIKLLLRQVDINDKEDALKAIENLLKFSNFHEVIGIGQDIDRDGKIDENDKLISPFNPDGLRDAFKKIETENKKKLLTKIIEKASSKKPGYSPLLALFYLEDEKIKSNSSLLIKIIETAKAVDMLSREMKISSESKYFKYITDAIQRDPAPFSTIFSRYPELFESLNKTQKKTILNRLCKMGINPKEIDSDTMDPYTLCKKYILYNIKITQEETGKLDSEEIIRLIKFSIRRGSDRALDGLLDALKEVLKNENSSQNVSNNDKFNKDAQALLKMAIKKGKTSAAKTILNQIDEINRNQSIVQALPYALINQSKSKNSLIMMLTVSHDTSIPEINLNFLQKLALSHDFILKNSRQILLGLTMFSILESTFSMIMQLKWINALIFMGLAYAATLIFALYRCRDSQLNSEYEQVKTENQRPVILEQGDLEESEKKDGLNIGIENFADALFNYKNEDDRLYGLSGAFFAARVLRSKEMRNEANEEEKKFLTKNKEAFLQFIKGINLEEEVAKIITNLYGSSESAAEVTKNLISNGEVFKSLIKKALERNNLPIFLELFKQIAVHTHDPPEDFDEEKFIKELDIKELAQIILKNNQKEFWQVLNWYGFLDEASIQEAYQEHKLNLIFKHNREMPLSYTIGNILLTSTSITLTAISLLQLSFFHLQLSPKTWVAAGMGCDLGIALMLFFVDAVLTFYHYKKQFSQLLNEGKEPDLNRQLTVQ